MQTKSWIAQPKADRNAAMRALKNAGFKPWHGAGKRGFSVKAGNEDDRERVELDRA